MTIYDNNKKVDQAWKNLYGRLEREGLLNESQQKRDNIFGSVVFRIAASFVFLLGAALFIYNGVRNSEQEMLLVHNSEESTTFVRILEDGSTVYLAENSSLTYPKHFRKNKREVFLSGDAFFEVSKKTEQPFIIETELINIEVLGTSFNVKSRTNTSPSLSVRTGHVRVTLKSNGQAVKLTAGQSVIIQSGKLLSIPTEDLNQFQGINKRMHFKDERLGNVIDIINRNLEGIKLEIAPNLNDRSITATFSENSPDSIVSMICIALNLKYSQENSTIRIYE